MILMRQSPQDNYEQEVDSIRGKYQDLKDKYRKDI